jgi:VWFA-related protein
MIRMVKKFKIFFCIMFLVCIISADYDRIEKIDFSDFSSAHPYVSIYLKVFDPDGRGLKDLKKEDILVKINNSVCDNFFIKRSSTPDKYLRVVAVVDVSGSMSKALDDEKNALMGFTKELGIYDEIALVTFNQEAKTRPFTLDKQEFNSWLDGALKAGGKTALYKAVDRSIGLFGQSSNRREVMVLISDGYEWGSENQLKFRDIEEKVEQSGIEIYTIGLGDINRKELKRIAAISGGKHFGSPGSKDLPGIYKQIVRGLKDCYMLSNIKLDDIKKNGKCRVEVTILPKKLIITRDFVPNNKIYGNFDRSFGLRVIFIGQDLLLTITLIVFILILIALTWRFTPQRFLWVKVVISFILLLVFILMQYIFYLM